MAFTSLSFLFIFLPLFALVYYWFSLRIRNYLLSLFSMIFLCWAGPSYSIVLVFSVILNWLFGLLISNRREKSSGKRLFIMAVICNLLLLVVFKYSVFLMGNINHLLLPFDLKTIKLPSILLPLGISFYTFRLLSYQIELYRGKVTVQRNILKLFLFTSYFPQLGAGPIVRYSEFHKQIDYRKHNLALFKNGFQRFLLGLAKKVILANNLGIVADAVFKLSDADQTFTTSWLGVISYTLQVYYDFSGYTDMAIGLSAMTGFKAPENFNFPYLAKSVKDFWRRWHMSLTSWFRDFLFLPLAFYFSRKLPGSKYLRIKTELIVYAISILITWLLVGLWHGASWTFIAWGATFGFFLILEQMGLGRKLKKAGTVIQHIYTLAIVMLAWVFFRAESFSQGFVILKGMSGINGMNSPTFEYYRYFTHSFIFILLVAIAGAAGWLNTLRMLSWKYLVKRQTKGKLNPGAGFNKLIYRGLIAVLLLFCFELAVSEILSGGYSPFIYFKF